MYPAIQFYSSGRVVRFLKLEATSTAAATAVSQTYLASLQEVESSVGYGSLGKAGDLGYTFGTNRKVTVNTSTLTQSLSMHPPSNHDGKVRLRFCVDGEVSVLISLVLLAVVRFRAVCRQPPVRALLRQRCTE